MIDVDWKTQDHLLEEIERLAKDNERLRAELKLLRQDNHSLWGSLRNRMAADATRTLPR